MGRPHWGLDLMGTPHRVLTEQSLAGKVQARQEANVIVSLKRTKITHGNERGRLHHVDMLILATHVYIPIKVNHTIAYVRRHA